MKTFFHGLLSFLAVSLCLFCPGAIVAEERLPRLAHHQPGLITDLGVGLWAWPLPMDFNGNGLVDMVVACTDVPANGVYVFLNSGQVDPGTQLPLFNPPSVHAQRA